MGHVQRFDFIPENLTDSQYDHEYKNVNENGFQRGGQIFIRPKGWKKYALKVTGKYENDQWFGPEGRTNEMLSVNGEWSVSYHGTKNHWIIPDIIKNGYDINKNVRSSYGKGIYSSPYPDQAEAYAEKFEYNGKMIKALMMNRTNMGHTNTVNDGKFLVTTNDRMIRPIAVLIKEF